MTISLLSVFGILALMQVFCLQDGSQAETNIFRGIRAQTQQKNQIVGINGQQQLEVKEKHELELLPSTSEQKVIRNTDSTDTFPKIVWTFWNKESKNPNHYHNMFRANKIKMLEGWEVRDLNQSTVHFWLDQIPDFGNVLEQPFFKNQREAKKADLIRIALLKHFGGVWIDFTMILLENFDWLLNLKDQKAVDFAFGDSPDVLFLTNSKHGEKQRVYDHESQKDFLLNPSLEVFFIAAKQKSKYLQEVFDIFVYGREQSFNRYGNSRSKSYFMDVKNSQQIKVGRFNNPYFEISIATSIVLQRKQKELDQRYFSGVDAYRRFAVKQYKLWVIGTNSSAYFYSYMPNTDILNILAQTDIDLLKKNDLFPRYFIKLFSQLSNSLENFIIIQEQLFESLKCKWNYYILENSILYRFLLSVYNVSFYYNPIESRPFSHNCFKVKEEIEFINMEKYLSTKMNIFQNFQSKIKKMSKMSLIFFFSLFLFFIGLIFAIVNKYRFTSRKLWLFIKKEERE